MLNIWKTNTGVYAPQWLGYFIVIVFFDKENIEGAMVTEAIIAAGIAISAGLFMLVGDKLVEGIHSFTIFLQATAAAIIQLPRGLIPGDSIALIVALVCLVVAVWWERKEGESIVGCFATAIPGMGIPIGGVILLWLMLRRRNVSAV